MFDLFMYKMSSVVNYIMDMDHSRWLFSDDSISTSCVAITRTLFLLPAEFRGAHGSPQQRQTQLHKLLQSAKSHVVRGRSTLEGLSDNNQVLHTLKDMRRFSKEGFRLVGWVPLQDEVFSTHQTVKTDSFTGRTDPGSDVRALRVTNTGLLYATHYDMAALARTLRKANPTASQRTLNTRRQLHECGGLPDLPHFNPDEAHLPRKHLQMRKPGCSRRLLQGTPKQVEDNADKDELSALEDSEVEISDQEVADITSKSSSAPANMTLPACKNMTAVLAGINATSETNCSSNSTDLTFTPAAGIEDDLTELLDGRGVCTPMKFPYKAIGQLELRDSKRMSVCTGAMVGDDAVLTAGHCVFKRDGDGGAFYKSLSFAPGRYRTGTGYKDPYGVIPWAWATVFDTYQAVSPRCQRYGCHPAYVLQVCTQLQTLTGAGNMMQHSPRFAACMVAKAMYFLHTWYDDLKRDDFLQI